MDLKDKIQIVLITYNRKECLEKTLNYVFAENSPIKDFDITILNNCSTDGSGDLIDKYCKEHGNLKHIINPVNIGGCANIAKALVEIPKKEYVWVMCDNDDYDWSCWGEVEDAVNKGADVIFTQKCPDKIADIFYKATLVSACIYKTKNITETVVENIYDSIKFLFPHLAVIAKNINDNNSVFIVSKDIVFTGINPGHDTTFIRGCEKEDLPETRRNIFWSVGYFSTIELIKDRKKQIEIIDGARHFHKSLFDLFKSFMVKNKVVFNNYPYNFYQIFRVLNFRQKLKFLFAYLVINLSFKDYGFYEMRSKDKWVEYLGIINEQKYIDKLAKKLKDKKVMLYGAGLTADVLLGNYDLSGLNIVGISDKRFERVDEKEFHNIKTYKPDELKDADFDIVLFTMKLYKRAEKALKDSGLRKKTASLIKKSSKYVVRS